MAIPFPDDLPFLCSIRRGILGRCRAALVVTILPAPGEIHPGPAARSSQRPEAVVAATARLGMEVVVWARSRTAAAAAVLGHGKVLRAEGEGVVGRQD